MPNIASYFFLLLFFVSVVLLYVFAIYLCDYLFKFRFVFLLSFSYSLVLSISWFVFIFFSFAVLASNLSLYAILFHFYLVFLFAFIFFFPRVHVSFCCLFSSDKSIFISVFPSQWMALSNFFLLFFFTFFFLFFFWAKEELFSNRWLVVYKSKATSLCVRHEIFLANCFRLRNSFATYLCGCATKIVQSE